MSITVELTPLAPGLEGALGLRMEAGATVADVLECLDLELPVGMCLGIRGRPVDMNWRLKEGDRIEFYRPLRHDPKTARRTRASGRDH